MYVAYYLFNWKRPRLSEADEIELGRQIALHGREHFITDFRRSMRRFPKKERKEWSPGKILLFILVSGVCLSGLISMDMSDYKRLGLKLLFVGGPAIVICLFFTHMSMRSSEKELREWMDYLVAKYASVSEQTHHDSGSAKWN